MNSLNIIQNTACHLVIGFLGSGKTSFINYCIQHWQNQQNWAILVNEVGKIGIDENLFNKNQKINVKQVTGGCICCTSQLPLQIALSRLLSEHRPDRLWIEPTGLAHPKELINQLCEPHWQTALALKSVFCLLNAKQWQQTKYQTHENYQSHIKYSDNIIINRFEHLTNLEIDKLKTWIYQHNPNAEILFFSNQTENQKINAMLHQPTKILENHNVYQKFSLQTLIPQNLQINHQQKHLPFRYHDNQQNYFIIGWQLPENWQTDALALMDWLLTLPDWQRIKAIIHTKNGWQRLNFTPDSINLSDGEPQIDNRIEIIFSSNNQQNLLNKWDKILIDLFHNKKIYHEK